MKRTTALWMTPLLTVVALAAAPAVCDAGESTTVEAKIRDVEATCAENADAMAERQAKTPLYDRLGGSEKIHAIVEEIVRLHHENEEIQHLFEGVDTEHLVDGVARFLVTASGGPEVYEGPDMVKVHAHLRLTNEDFMSAAGDVMQAMENEGCGEAERQEVACALMSLREQVVMPSEGDVSRSGHAAKRKAASGSR